MEISKCLGILAGGKGIRMGGNKPFKMFKDKPLILWVYEAVLPFNLKVYLSVRSPDQGERLLGLIQSAFPKNSHSLNVSIVQDVAPFEGPLAGVYSLLSTMKEEEILILTCDQPLIKTEFLQRLLRQRAEACLFEIEGNAEPFPLKLTKSVFPYLENFIKISKKKSIKEFLNLLQKYDKLTKLSLKGEEVIFLKNINTPQELEELSNV
jgi:molybdopterin-guanine dinucleotide biosynthesis protein A